MKLGTKIVTAAALAVILTTLGSIMAVYVVSKHNRVEALREVMNTTLSQAEQVRSQFETIHRDHGIDLKGLEERAKSQNVGRALKDVYQNTALYNTIPIVASWQSVKEIARQKGFEFYRPTHPKIAPRNPQNAFDPRFAAVFDDFNSGKTNYFRYDKQQNALVLARPVRLTENCLICHGSPSTSPTHDGNDFLGQPMEDLKAGDLKGAFVLVAPMTDDPVVGDTMWKIFIMGVLVLLVVTGAFFVLNQRMIIRPLELSIERISESREQSGQASREIRDASGSLAEAASEQAASLEQTSSSLEEMAGVTKQNADSAQKVKDLATEARQAADLGANDMQQMSQAMLDIKQASDGIDKIIKNIDEIAFQTNILALNAAVEAARAGEAGLGFAVVAEEVRNLAQRSASAAKETAAKIEDSIVKSNRGVEISARVAANLEAIVAKVRKVDEVVAEIAAASKEQSQGIEQVNIAVTQMDRVTQSNAAMAEQTASAAEELNAQSKSLEEAVEHLIILVEGVRQTRVAKPQVNINVEPPKPSLPARVKKF
jgi:methyl-accepting chemotaxis protein